MSKTFDFDPDLWFTNRALRGCSPSARGLWVDLLAIMYAEGGYLTVNGAPIDDAKLSRMVGEPAAMIRKWIKELGEAGIFSVDERGRMFSSRMVRRCKFAEQAKKHGAEGVRRKKEKSEVATSDAEPAATITKTFIESAAHSVEAHALPEIRKPLAPAKRAAAWWKTPAGWARHGLQQALPMKQGEVYEEYQCRLAARIPPGAHLDVLSPRQQKMVEALRPKDPNAKQE